MKNRINGILIDFDGVISKSAVENIIKFVHEFISQRTPITLDFIRSFIKNVACFPPDLTIPMLLKSLGLQDHLSEFYLKFNEFDNSHDFFPVEPDFAEFIEFCQKNSIQNRIFSLASPARLKVLGLMEDYQVYSLKGKSKADIQTFKDLRDTLKIELGHWIYIDDNPVALRTGKLEGLNTVMMINSVYTENDFIQFRKFIDLKIDSFSELRNYLSRMFNPK